MDQVAAVRDPCYFELALRDQSIEQRTQRGRPELVPEDSHVAVIASVELAGTDPPHRTLHRERLLLTGEVVDASVQNLHKLFPLVCWNVVEGCHGAITVGAGSDTTRKSVGTAQPPLNAEAAGGMHLARASLRAVLQGRPVGLLGGGGLAALPQTSAKRSC
jgi:hypothetical protein